MDATIWFFFLLGNLLDILHVLCDIPRLTRRKETILKRIVEEEDSVNSRIDRLISY